MFVSVSIEKSCRRAYSRLVYKDAPVVCWCLEAGAESGTLSLVGSYCSDHVSVLEQHSHSVSDLQFFMRYWETGFLHEISQVSNASHCTWPVGVRSLTHSLLLLHAALFPFP